LHDRRVKRARGPVTIVAACAFACGGRSSKPTLGAPGTDADDGAGQLASASSQILVGGGDDDTGFAPDRRAAYDASAEYGAYGYGGGMYGGGAYGGGLYGGYLYGAYAPYATLATTPANPPNPYSGVGITDGGAITGTVRWPRPPSAPAVLSLPGCGELANPTLAIGHAAGVGDTVVYLARVDRGRAVPVAGRMIQVGGAVERRGCALAPTVQVATPVPTSLTIINADGGPIGVLVGVAGKEAKLAIDDGMSRSTPLAAGPARIADDAGALIPAWVVGVSHPYYTLTDGEGRFRIDDVPPGAYDLVVWHAPVVVGVKDGRIVATAAVEVRRSVIVKTSSATVVGVDLPVAPVAK
jgi:hypothetical protein